MLLYRNSHSRSAFLVFSSINHSIFFNFDCFLDPLLCSNSGLLCVTLSMEVVILMEQCITILQSCVKYMPLSQNETNLARQNTQCKQSCFSRLESLNYVNMSNSLEYARY